MIQFLLAALLAVAVVAPAQAKGADDFKAGAAAQRRNDFDEAIRLYTRALDAGDLRQSDQVSVHNRRGIAYLATAQYDRAIADFDASIRLVPDNNGAYTNRGYANFFMARYAAAAGDFERSLNTDPAQPYVLLWLHLARSRAGQDDTQELARSAAKIDMKSWPGPVVALYLGQVKPEQVTAAAARGDATTQREHGCEASFHLGEDALLHRNAGEAERLFRKAREICPAGFVEYSAAQAELTRMGK